MSCTHTLSLLFISFIVLPFLSLANPLYEIFRLAVLAWRAVFSVENVTGKVVLITGAASGIGEQLAYEYARRRARLALIDINEDRLKEVSDKARGLGSPDTIWVHADVSKFEDSENFINRTIEHFGRLDHLVNNAAIGASMALFENYTNDLAIARNIMDTNFWGSVYSTQFGIPHLLKSKGKIIAIASVNGHLPLPKTIFYNASKAALISLYETLRVEMGQNIGITIVTPGVIDTPLTRGAYISNMGNMGMLPPTSAAECAKQIVESGCRGDAYLRVPDWIRPGILFKALYPELTSYLLRCFFLDKGTRRAKMS